MKVFRIFRSTVLASAVALSFSAAADTLPPDIVERGDGWELMLVAPPVDGPATTSLDPAPIVSVSSADGLAASPLPQSIKDELAADFAGGEEVVVNVRQDLAQAFADGTAEQQFGEFVEPDEATGGVGASAICDGGWRERHLTRSRSFDGFSHTFSESAGNFRGNLAFAVPLSGEASVDVTYAYRKKFCIPWAVKFVNARVAGVLDVGETLIEANGTATFEKSDRVVVAKPAFEDTFTIGPVPVRIGVEFPLGVGYDIKATASAQLALKSRAQGELRFDLTCTRGGCTRNAPADNASTVTFDDLIHPTVAGSASVRLDAKPYAFVEANAWLYHDALAKAGLGLEVAAPSRLFYYVGNQCGNANGSTGNGETVNGGFVDVSAQLALYYRTTLFGNDRFNWLNTPLSSIGGYFHEYPVTDFLRGGDAFTALRHTLYFSPAKFGGGAHALSPILTGETDGEVDLGATGTFNAKMRPCVPLDEPMTYVVNWGDGTQSSKTGLPTQNAPMSHVWSTSGNKALTITATQGVGPRTLNLSSGRTIVSNALAPPPTPTTVTVPSTDPDGAFALQWTCVANVEQYEIQRSSAGGAFVAVATVVAPATSKALTAQPYGNSVYRVRAVNNFGNGGWRNSANILVGHVPSTPALTVRSLMCEGLSDVDWTATANTTAYKLYTSATNNASGAAEIYSGLGRHYLIDVTQRHYLWVKACGTGGCSAVSPAAIANVHPGECN